MELWISKAFKRCLQLKKLDLKLVPLDVQQQIGDQRQFVIKKAPGLKAEANAANGGIGISFSNLALGRDNSQASLPRTSYQQHYEDSRNSKL